jgi:hypothetical protein
VTAFKNAPVLSKKLPNSLFPCEGFEPSQGFYLLQEEGMQHRKLAFWLITAGLLFLITTGIFFLLPAQPVSAQCGSQASSCKNCHETQAQDPVSNDLTTWHGQHAFGDFCYLCHGGNNQATDKAAAHTGMIDPLSDVVVNCKSCHPNDFEARAQIYADTLGIKVGSLKATLSATESAPTNAPAALGAAVPVAPAAIAVAAVVPAADMVDYSQRYDEVALGKKPANIGNIILVLMIAAMLLGGGFFIACREGLFKISFQETKVIQDSYPVDVVDMVPQIAKLSPAARRDLSLVLTKPGTAAEVFALVQKLTKGEIPPASTGEEPAEPPEEENPNS